MAIREEFDKRLLEVNTYFEILQLLELDKPKLSAHNIESNQSVEINFDSRRINILRSNAFLLLYNLVESTVFNSVTSIFDAVNSDRHNPKLKYFDVIDAIKKYWLNNVYKHDEKIKKETVVKSFMEIANRIFSESLSLASNYLKYGGTLDAESIEDTAIDLGVNIGNLKNGFDKNTHGEAFRQIKRNRNWLAHGDKSFAEIGQDFPYNRLDEWKLYIVEHLEKFIMSIETYIRDEKYKVPVIAAS
ncbi:MAE_28990/MAE_18760 family HEPN-like nuclease [Bacteroides sp. 519]|uniref:MAE_28990/MAE_18760 family HEPN-like nuclease n=1 Tax=Bacteroides sp. 519 TaxID=2302937 RepID=UPI0013D89AA4|nr:MAE_28990/MAE_18760 family HEPN-like nuclease [Bacteroides sp. 519]NDV57238.1 hypothetical protein [Bacteroides sp. 519]